MSSKQAAIFWGISIASILLALALILLYLSNFWSPNFSRRIETWGAFGDYFGGTASAIFSLISLLAILATTSVQISIANKNAYAAQQEMVKQSNAVVSSSRLETINFLYKFYSAEIIDINKNKPKTGTRMGDRLSEIEAKINALKSITDTIYNATMQENDPKEN